MNCHLPEDTTPTTGAITMNLYDINKQLIAQLPELNEEQIIQARKVITDFIKNLNNDFFMLLGRDINYYTLFNIVNNETEHPLCAVADEVWACADYIGSIKSVDLIDEENAIEIWVQPRDEEGEPLAMYLFGYDEGVVKCVV